MPDTHSHPARSRKLGGIPQGEDTSPGIYRKPPSFKMRIIPRPPEKEVARKKQSSAPLYLGLSAIVLVLLLGGGAAYVHYKTPSQLTAWWQRATPAPATVGKTSATVATATLADTTLGFVWLFDENEWRKSDGQHEAKDGLAHVRSKMEKPQAAADATIRARLLIREGGGTAGVFLRSTPEEGRYRLAIDPDLRFVRLVHEGPGGTQELGKYRFFKALLRDDRLVLELRAEGKQLFGSINGQQVIEAEDARSTKAGTWGIESNDAWFELVEVPVPFLKSFTEVTKRTAPVPVPVAPATPAPTPAAPPPPAPAAPVVAAQSDTAKWLVSMEPQWQANFEKEVMAPFNKSAGDLKKQFMGTLDAQLATATQAKKLDDAAFFRGERKRLEAGEDVPMTDESIVPPALKSLRNGYRTALAEFDRQRFGRAKAFFARTDAQLSQSESALVQRQRNGEAAEVKAKREQLAALWVKPPMSVVAPSVSGANAATAANRPSLTATPAPALPKMTSRQVVEKLLAIGAEVWVTQKGSTNMSEVKNAAAVATERFTITRVNFRRQNEGEKQITTADLAILDALGEITELDLHGPEVTDAIVEKLRAIRRLEKLTLDNAKIGTPSATVLATLTDLRELRLTNVGLSDDAFKVIGQCHRIERLYLTSLQIGDAALAPIAKLPDLQELDLNNLDKLTAAGLSHLAECRTLRRLSFNGSNATPSMLEAIGRCTSIETLNLAGNALKDDQVAGLSTLTKLHSLNLNNTGIVGTAFASWPARAAMTTLNLTNKPGVNDAALKAIGSAFPKLENLDISGVPLGATPAGFASIARLRSLRSLHVEGGVVNDEIMVEIDRCPELQRLSIPGGRLTESGVAALARLPRLNSLELGVPPITEAALKSFAKCKMLKSMEIAGDAPAETEAKLRSAIEGITIRRN